MKVIILIHFIELISWEIDLVGVDLVVSHEFISRLGYHVLLQQV